tara:strand:- start:1396 stop:2649 length:1254 start_codon:yes stop_codon:yes gene_type:complete
MINNFKTILLFLLFLNFFSFAEKEKVLFCDIAYSGNVSNLSKEFKFTSSSNTTDLIRINARKVLENLEIDNFELLINNADDFNTVLGKDSDIKLGLVILIDGEYINKKSLSKYHTYQYWISGQLIFFDTISKRVVICKPFGAIQDIISESKRTDDQHLNAFNTLLIGNKDDEIGVFFDSLSKKIKEVRLDDVSGRYLQIKEINLSQEAINEYNSIYPNINNFKKFIASSVINSFSDNLQTPFLPYVVGDSGGNKDENRLTDAGAFTVNIINNESGSTKKFDMKIPESDYQLDIEIPPFVKHLVKEGPGYKQYIFGTYMKIKLWEPFGGQIFFEERFKNGIVQTLPSKNEKNIPSLPFYMLSIIECSQKVSGNLNKLSEKLSKSEAQEFKTWLKGQGVKSLEKKMLNFKKILEKCKNG